MFFLSIPREEFALSFNTNGPVMLHRQQEQGNVLSVKQPAESVVGFMIHVFVIAFYVELL